VNSFAIFVPRFSESGYGSNYLGWREGQKANGTAPAVEASELGTSDAAPSVPADAPVVDVAAVPASGGAIDFTKE
jgi:hypothetical protein